MSVKIIIDSTVDLPQAVKARCGVAPLSVLFGEESYLDGVTINHKEFYDKLVSCEQLPTTSQPTPDSFAKLYKQAVAAGQQVVVVTISSGLSGTYQSATIAAMDYENEVFVVDSLNAAIGAGILTELALKMADEGKDARTIAETLTAERENIVLLAMLDTLEYLKKGGRISKTVAFAGELLSIKPIITVEEGAIKVLGKARGTKQGNTMLVKKIDEVGGADFTKPILLGYTGNDDTLLRKYQESSADLWQGCTDNLESCCIGSAIGVHVGPGAVAVAFFKK